MPTKDINKDTIMSMLRTDVFGFKHSDIERKAEQIYHLVGGQKGGTGGYKRNRNGFINIVSITPNIAI